MQQMLNKASGYLEAVNEWTGKLISWFVLFMVLTTFVIVVMRYVFNVGSIAMQESVIYAHVFVFMLGAGFALKHNQHVRVDIFYHRMSVRSKAGVDLFGTLFFLVPVSVFILYSSWEYVMDSIELKESSREAGGLPFIYFLKTQIIVMSFLLLCQAIAEVLKNVLVLSGKAERPVA